MTTPHFTGCPDDAGLAAQYLLLYEFSLPFGSDLNDRIDVSKSATRLSAVAGNLTGRQLRALDERAQAWLLANAPAMATAASGTSMIFAHLSQRNIESMLRGTIIGDGPEFPLILIGVLKSLRMGLISLLPNFIPAAMSFGLWGYLVGRVGMAASVVTVVAFGIIVDDTIHFLTGYMRARKEGLSSPDAVRATFRTVGHALATTTAGAVGGFPGVCRVGIRSQLGAGHPGHDDPRHCAADRFPAAPAAADGHRPLARSARCLKPPRGTGQWMSARVTRRPRSNRVYCY